MITFFTSDSLASSQFPVFTLYGERLCVPGAKAACPGRAWVADRVREYRYVMSSFVGGCVFIIVFL